MEKIVSSHSFRSFSVRIVLGVIAALCWSAVEIVTAEECSSPDANEVPSCKAPFFTALNPIVSKISSASTEQRLSERVQSQTQKSETLPLTGTRLSSSELQHLLKLSPAEMIRELRKQGVKVLIILGMGPESPPANAEDVISEMLREDANAEQYYFFALSNRKLLSVEALGEIEPEIIQISPGKIIGLANRPYSGKYIVMIPHKTTTQRLLVAYIRYKIWPKQPQDWERVISKNTQEIMERTYALFDEAKDFLEQTGQFSPQMVREILRDGIDGNLQTLQSLQVKVFPTLDYGDVIVKYRNELEAPKPIIFKALSTADTLIPIIENSFRRAEVFYRLPSKAIPLIPAASKSKWTQMKILFDTMRQKFEDYKSRRSELVRDAQDWISR
jgi:hypothetical protein